MSEESVYLSGVQFNNSKLLRGYFFRNRFGEAYGLTNPPDETIDRVNAGLHLDSVFDRHKHLLDPRIEHFIGILWTNGKGTGGRMIDLFGFTQEKNWPGNPEVYNWVFRNGGYIPGSVAVTCSNGWRTIAN